MSRPPLRVLLVEGPGPHPRDGSYLEMLLSIHGRFHVVREGDGDDGDGCGHDAVLVAADSLPRMEEVPSGAPVIVLPRWHPEPGEVVAMVEAGAEDVLPMAELNAARLESVVRKAVGRRNRAQPRRQPLRQALADTAATPGISAWLPTGPFDERAWVEA